MKRKLIVALVVTLAVIISISAIYTTFRYREPETAVTSLELIDVDEDSKSFRLGLTIKVTNPNNLRFDLKSIEGDVLIDGEFISPLYNSTGAEVPARDTAEIVLTIVVDDTALKVLSGGSIEVKGTSYGKYLWVEGRSDFEESMDIQGIGDLPVNLPPLSVIRAPFKATVFEEVEFDGSFSLDQDGEIVEFRWDMGDGTTEYGEIVHHRYTSFGLYEVELVVTDDRGDNATAVHQINIRIVL